MKIDDEYFDRIISLITLKTGIIPRESHKAGIRTYVENKLDTLTTDDKMFQYFMLVSKDEDIFMELINQSTVNETYFFREDKQFNFLNNRVLKEWPFRKGNEQINIWCAACSSGEEAYSLALLCKENHIKASITASDINNAVLEKCRQGIYKENSIRKGDGESYHRLLKPYMQPDGSIKIDDDTKHLVKPQHINLVELDNPKNSAVIPKNQNIIFIRNVFIYFSMDVRAKILKNIAEKCMAEDGLLFVSMNEIAPLDSGIIPKELEKVVDGDVFFFHKKK